MTQWRCVACQAVRASEAGLVDTLAPGVKSGRCSACGKNKTPFRPVAADAAGGAALKERGMDQAETAEALIGDWVEKADAELKRLAGSGERFTAETLTGRIGMPSHAKAVGARFNAAARKGLIRKVGFTRANRRAAHSRDLAVWEGIR